VKDQSEEPVDSSAGSLLAESKQAAAGLQSAAKRLCSVLRTRNPEETASLLADQEDLKSTSYFGDGKRVETNSGKTPRLLEARHRPQVIFWL